MTKIRGASWIRIDLYPLFAASFWKSHYLINAMRSKKLADVWNANFCISVHICDRFKNGRHVFWCRFCHLPWRAVRSFFSLIIDDIPASPLLPMNVTQCPLDCDVSLRCFVPPPPSRNSRCMNQGYCSSYRYDPSVLHHIRTSGVVMAGRSTVSSRRLWEYESTWSRRASGWPTGATNTYRVLLGCRRSNCRNGRLWATRSNTAFQTFSAHGPLQ